ncbi:hypothetical protein LUZ60_000142 [Juncus effusus]|nr:hypothetical protein LUZ60_000142 [Juncus effusus]
MAEVPILMFVGKAAATAVIGNRVNWAITKIEEFLSSEGLEATKRNLDRNLPHIQAVLLAVDRGLIKDRNEALDKWLWQLRDAVEEAENAVDELDYHKLEEKVKSQYNGIHVGCTVPNSTTVFIKKQIMKLVKHIPKPDDATLKRLKGAVEGLNTAASGVGAFLQLINGIIKTHNDSNNNKDHQQTGAMLTEEVFGRDKEKDMILKWISDSGGNSEMDSNVSALSIVGMGGIGKTTLARLIYKEVETKRVGNFSRVMWVSVSDIFETLNSTAITRMILQDITKESWNNIENPNTLQKHLQSCVASEKFFLVLENIWRDEPDSETQLKQIIAPLKFGQKGSKILFTTRMGLVADMIAKVMEEPGRKKNQLVLGGLEEREFVKLFNKNVFCTEDPDVNKNFQTAAKKIARKVGGSPLGAEVMGRLLNNRMDIQHWNRIAEQDISEIEISKNGIVAVMKLNYHHLDGNVQQCLRFCSLFPRNHKFKKDELIQMWIGSGLIQLGMDNKRLEDAGAENFNTLIKKSFFCLSEDSENCYIMHDLMHGMVVTVSSGECLRTDDVSESIPKTIRHLSIKIKNLIAIKEISHVKHLQSLFIEFTGEKPPEKGELKKFEKYLGKMKSLRLLSLIGDNLFELPKTVGNLKHLRYISLHQTGKKKELEWFPSSVYKLYQLQVMIFTASDVRDLTKVKMGGVNNLINLRTLNVHSSVMRNIPHISKLISLQKLMMFNITEGRKITELKDLKEFRELEIQSLENVQIPQDAKEAKLNEKENLRTLSLNWSQTECFSSNEILGNLQPHNNIQTIRISGYNADKFPVWMTNFSFRNLLSLKLKDCGKLKNLPSLGNLPSLQILILSKFPELTEIGSSFYGKRSDTAFLSLKELIIQNMDKLEKWVEIEIIKGRKIFPRLEVLRLEGCPLLTKLPLTLPHLDIQNSGLNMIPTGLKSLKKLSLNQCPTLLSNQNWENSFPSSVEELKIEGCGDGISLESSIRNLSLLTRLDLIDCPDIKSLPPAEVFVNLVSLSKISISDCKELSSLGGLKVLFSLKYLKLTGCTQLIKISQEMHTKIDSKEIKNENPTLCLEDLFIDHCSLLLIKPIKSHCCTKKLNISKKCEEIFLPKEWLIQNRAILKEMEIDDASALETVPPSLVEFKSMEKLKLNQASQIKSFANLPSSLSDLIMTGCSEAVKEMYRKDTGSNWYEIEDIPFVVIS